MTNDTETKTMTPITRHTAYNPASGRHHRTTGARRGQFVAAAEVAIAADREQAGRTRLAEARQREGRQNVGALRATTRQDPPKIETREERAIRCAGRRASDHRRKATTARARHIAAATAWGWVR